MSFTKVIEDFSCEQCGFDVVGRGYTNHCPRCLWSKHVDIEPGDRAASCGGLMQPIALEGSSPEYVIVHECTRCHLRRKNKAQNEDRPEALLDLARRS